MILDRLSWVDVTDRGSGRREHSFLTRDDRCLFFGELHRGRQRRGTAMRSLMADFKRRHSQHAAEEISGWLRRQFTREEVERLCTFVPIPTSKRRDHPQYCDRLERTLRLAFEGYRADIRLLLRQTVSTSADHRSGERRIRYERLLQITELDRHLLAQALRPVVVLFDDVLTTGKHYRVAERCLHEVLPEQPIVGLFVARCIHG